MSARRRGVLFEIHTPITVGDRPWPYAWYPLATLSFHWGEDVPQYLLDLRPEPREDCKLTGGDCWDDLTMMQAEAGYLVFEGGGTDAMFTWLAEIHLPSLFIPR